MGKGMQPKFDMQMRDARELSRQCKKEHAHNIVSCNADVLNKIEDCDRVHNAIQLVRDMMVPSGSWA